MTVNIPYGKTHLTYTPDGDRPFACLTSDMSKTPPPKPQGEIIEDALASPIGSPTLAELAVGKKKIVIIASDHTRPVPSKFLIPPMLRELRRGNPDADITILIATGCHRLTSRDELAAKFGEDIIERENIVIHDCDAPDAVSLGTLPSGGELTVDRIAAECDLLVSEGFIEPHFFAGFSGGRKSVLPGIASRATVMANHCSRFIADDRARAGILDGNPIHTDMLWAAKRIGLAFVLNVILNAEHEIVYAVAGDADAAHRSGCDYLTAHCGVKRVECDIAITSNGGYPLDQNIYQAVKCMTAAEACVRQGGVVIICAESGDGHGGEGFYRTFAECDSIDALTERFLSTAAADTVPDQWQSQIFARVLSRAKVIYISSCDSALVKEMHMIPAHSVAEAVAIADSLLGYKGSITVIPDGVSVTVV